MRRERRCIFENEKAHKDVGMGENGILCREKDEWKSYKTTWHVQEIQFSMAELGTIEREG